LRIKRIIVWSFVVSLSLWGLSYEMNNKKQAIRSNNYPINVKVEDVLSAELIPSHGGAGAFSLPLSTDKAQDREAITKILTWLHNSKVVGEVKNQFVSLGGNPTEFEVSLKNGVSIQFEAAVGAISSKLENGNTLVQSSEIKDQVVVVYSGKKPLQINSPELYGWIQNGWSKEEALQFTKTDAIAKVLEKQPDFPSSPDIVKTIYEDVGGMKGSKVKVDLKTTVRERGGMDYAVTLAKNYHLTVGGKEVIAYWKYDVDPGRATLIDSKDEMPLIK
jgi:hypothetical protein